uniref:Uncharacterized protein n=1 Tax=Anopheles atroparvus TaxID=41427 RepID=A0AAG5CS06_ANOAO
MPAAAIAVATGAVLIVLSVSPMGILFAAPVIVPIVATTTTSSSSLATTTIRTHAIPVAIAVPLAIAVLHHRGTAAAVDSFRAIPFTIAIRSVHVPIVTGRGPLVAPRTTIVPFFAAEKRDKRRIKLTKSISTNARLVGQRTSFCTSAASLAARANATSSCGTFSSSPPRRTTSRVSASVRGGTFWTSASCRLLPSPTMRSVARANGANGSGSASHAIPHCASAFSSAIVTCATGSASETASGTASGRGSAGSETSSGTLTASSSANANPASRHRVWPLSRTRYCSCHCYCCCCCCCYCCCCGRDC